ncbi:hypothetical protein L596_028761 [Steinernema carpocapsae]|uniref:Uncharacterized protein n=1 Tax=Steinernema carpocapsae TaxID=34508 RepID=A0A4U5LZA5_STECR|nr:hypothetical protein L596_028761 [Steinernema carpocapsae]
MQHLPFLSARITCRGSRCGFVAWQPGRSCQSVLQRAPLRPRPAFARSPAPRCLRRRRFALGPPRLSKRGTSAAVAAATERVPLPVRRSPLP